jgi:predicted dehydrogenase
MHYLKLKPTALYAVGEKKRLVEDFGKEAFDAVHVLVTYQSGMTVMFDTNWITPKDFEGPVNQESILLGKKGKVESDSQYRGLRYWIEGEGTRTVNTHFFRTIERPDGTHVSVGYGKDSLIACTEKIYRIRLLNATAKELEGTYPDAKSQRLTTAVVHAARNVVRRNQELLSKGLSPTATASFGKKGIILHDPETKEDITIYNNPI